MTKTTKRMVNSYNSTLVYVGYECSMTTECAEAKSWNLRDMVAECDYILSLYYEDGTCQSEMYEECYDCWKAEVKRLNHFINLYKDRALTMKCTSSHCSKYDN